MALYPYGSIVKLVAEPQTGNYFAHWTNSVGGGQNPRAFTVLSANPLVTAVFAPLSAGQFALTAIPNGPGRITTTPQTNRYASGASVTLRAIPDAGQTFTGWSGDAGGAQNPLIVTMDQNSLFKIACGELDKQNPPNIRAVAKKHVVSETTLR